MCLYVLMEIMPKVLKIVAEQASVMKDPQETQMKDLPHEDGEM